IRAEDGHGARRGVSARARRPGERLAPDGLDGIAEGAGVHAESHVTLVSARPRAVELDSDRPVVGILAAELGATVQADARGRGALERLGLFAESDTLRRAAPGRR